MKNIQTMKKIDLRLWAIVLVIIISMGTTFAQENEKEKKPVRAPFESSLLIDNQTIIVPTAKTLQFDMIHRFGVIENGISDFYGLYAPGANIRLGLTYSVVENLAVGIGFTKLNKYVDVNLKYAILKQTRDWSMPINLTYYGNATIDTRNGNNFEEEVHRGSFYHELLIATRFGPKLSLQVSPSYAHFNAVDSLMSNDIIAVGLSGRYKFSAQSSVIFEFNQQITTHDDIVDVKPNIGIGIEVSTSSHAFQMFISTFQGILPQHNLVFSENEFDTSGILIGLSLIHI